MKKEKKKIPLKYVIIILLVIAYGIGCLIFFSKEAEKKNSLEDVYVVFDENHRFSYRNQKINTNVNWLQVLGTKKFYSYSDGQYLGKYTLSFYQNQTYLFDRNNDSIDYSGDLFMYSASKKLDVVDTKIITINDTMKTYLTELLKDSNLMIPDDKYLNPVQEISVDLDNDGKMEMLYAINSIVNDQLGKTFSFVFYVKDGVIHRIVSDIAANEDRKKMHYYTIGQVMDLDYDGVKEIILRSTRYMTAPVQQYMVYVKNKSNYQLVTTE